MNPRRSIVARLLLAFLLVSILPIAILAVLSLQERMEVSGHGEERVAESGGQHTETSEGQAGITSVETETLFGIPIATIELGVAGASLILSVLMALYVGRSIIRPIRRLEAGMSQVEAGNLDVRSGVEAEDEIGHLARAFDAMTVGLRREVLIRDLFGQYVTPEVARIAIERRGQLDGQVVECSILFADIRGFTTLAETLPAHRLLRTLNQYLSAMLGEVVAEDGIVNKFGGDSILAIFGSPLNPARDHAARAVRAALRMRTALLEFNRGQAAQGLPHIRAGFGVATGDVVAGNVGSERKVEYTVIGDPVNLAARLQELTRELGREILVTEETAAQAGDVARMEPLGEVAIRGRKEPVRVLGAEELRAAPVPAQHVPARQS